MRNITSRQAFNVSRGDRPIVTGLFRRFAITMNTVGMRKRWASIWADLRIRPKKQELSGA